ncbi:MAG: F0F1 ATP synthase subunit epsilon [Pseudomonadota bacterium]|jgi:F-type H+-transporting ATPase subunit epsilon|uniref:ATP synthase epsilon chain n=1 Tax=Banduia mediterranea TaxID=3075609 RepID=A0ABU2WF79_9GAMM|nr:F0F1 ATP synthase subunit epsilon [Algiphilus sp. W345]MCH9829726.1 F0F1 ATP synthase subunit epsilon [Gammaproteobacteria bacterium]MDT0495946.1 F0F1 ATP synthase subunit epsilon [Algiphilus sp. W345]MEC9357308.1 F0F1 ATP synthase subunit epsilon [Pseudomonadota bacterium]
MSQLHVDIVSAEGHIHSGEAAMVFAPAELGEVGIAPKHSPLLTRLKPGEVRVKTADGEQLYFFVSGGLLEVQPHLVTVMADTALRAKDADEAAAADAKRAAEEAVENAKGEMDLARAQAELVEAAARLHFVKKLKDIR